MGKAGNGTFSHPLSMQTASSNEEFLDRKLGVEGFIDTRSGPGVTVRSDPHRL